MTSITQPSKSNPLGILVVLAIIILAALMLLTGPMMGATEQTTESAAVVVAADAAVADAGAWLAEAEDRQLKRLSDTGAMSMAIVQGMIQRNEWQCHKSYVSARLGERLELYSFGMWPGVEIGMVYELETGEFMWGLHGFSAMWRGALALGGFKEVGRAGTCPQ